MSFTIGSLFDGSGGFPLAAFMCGGAPVWASEVEPKVFGPSYEYRRQFEAFREEMRQKERDFE